MNKLRAALILFVLAAFAVGGTALAKSVAGSAQGSQLVADDSGPGHDGDGDGDSGHHGGDDGDHSGHHGDDDGDDDGHHGDDDDGTTTVRRPARRARPRRARPRRVRPRANQSRSSRPAAAVAGKRLIGPSAPASRSRSRRPAARRCARCAPAPTPWSSATARTSTTSICADAASTRQPPWRHHHQDVADQVRRRHVHLRVRSARLEHARQPARRLSHGGV